MRIALFLFVSFFSVALLGQSAADSAAIKQVDSLILVSRQLTNKQDFDKALEVNIAAEGVALLKFGRESVAYGSCCHNRGKISYAQRDFPEAIKWYLEAINIRAKILGKTDLNYSNSLNSLAYVYIDLGKYNDAEPLLIEVLSIREKVRGKEHSDYTASLTTLGTLYWYMGYYEKAEPLLLEAKTIQEKKVGQNQGPSPYTLNTLGTVYRYMGKYEKAEPLLLEANALFEKTAGRTNPDFAASLANLADFYLVFGHYPKAESLLLQAKEIFEVQLNMRNAPFYLNCLNSLAELYSETGNYEKAKLLTLELLAIRENEQGKEHPDYAKCLSALAALSESGNLNEAESLSLQAAAILENTIGKASRHYAFNSNILGGIYWKMHNYDKAESCFLQALTIQANLMGRENNDYLNTLKNLTALYISNGNYEKAETRVAEVASGYQSITTHALHHLSEQEMQQYLKTISNAQDNALHLAQATEGKRAVSICFNNSLFYKGFLLNTAEQIKRLAQSDSNTIQKSNSLKGYGRRLASQYALPRIERDSNLVIDLEEKANTIEKDLARTVGGYGMAMRQVSWQEVQAALKPAEVAIEFVYFATSPDSMMYAALVLLPAPNQPQFIPLFEENTLEALLKTSGGRKSDYVNRIYSPAIAPAKAGTAQKTAGKSLYELVWQPIEKALAGSPAFDKSTVGKKTIYFSLSGLLHRINLAAIPTSKTANLGDRFRFVELGSTRQLATSPSFTNVGRVSNPADVKTGSGEALLWGGIQYDMDSTGISTANATLKADLARTRGDLGFEKTDSTTRLACQSTGGSRGGSWEYLPWTEKEINAIAPIMTAAGVNPTSRKGFSATEEAFKTIGSNANANPADVKKTSPRILHIATHGYFFPDPKTADGGRTVADGSELTFKLSDHPMIRSGLLLAGANQAWKTGKPLRPDMEDGVLTAYEISQMDLSNTELVVLSACETGLGDIQGNEGVYGLQRAFKIAGAKYLIMSLWQVPDFQTQELMTVFYQKWLSAKMPLPEAFRTAQQAMREKYEHPYFWAGFVLVE